MKHIVLLKYIYKNFKCFYSNEIWYGYLGRYAGSYCRPPERTAAPLASCSSSAPLTYILSAPYSGCVLFPPNYITLIENYKIPKSDHDILTDYRRHTHSIMKYRYLGISQALRDGQDCILAVPNPYLCIIIMHE